MLRSFMEEAAKMPIIEYDGKSGEVIPEHQTHYQRFTDFVWERVYNLPVRELLRAVLPIGQTQKREAIEGICQEVGLPKEKAIYIGDKPDRCSMRRMA